MISLHCTRAGKPVGLELRSFSSSPDSFCTKVNLHRLDFAQLSPGPVQLRSSALAICHFSQILL
jgi:hypothetical protein